ncbi:hypothetical protein [Hyphomicrobium sp.]|uniref:hypothetical protein n=1 Tax=Hyphomicrobium sp. TaxID=82 RepID=UPI001D8C2219|nr:hypothetical protein [Hyphomicrobium sp.]MBY0560262.1 hypothetical protein [Hyphomicrobium sp.]
MTAADNREFHIYIDETSKSSTFMGAGALFSRKDSAREISDMMSAAVVSHGQRADKEIHWTELKNHLLPLYQEVGVKLIRYTQVKPYKMRYHAHARKREGQPRHQSRHR